MYIVHVWKEISLSFTTIACNLAVSLANLLLSIRVQIALLASNYVMQCLLQLALWKKKRHFLWCWYCGKKQIECGVVLSALLLTTIHIITVVEICCGFTQLCLVSGQPLWWCILIVDLRVQTKLNHVWFVKFQFARGCPFMCVCVCQGGMWWGGGQGKEIGGVFFPYNALLLPVPLSPNSHPRPSCSLLCK